MRLLRLRLAPAPQFTVYKKGAGRSSRTLIQTKTLYKRSTYRPWPGRPFYRDAAALSTPIGSRCFVARESSEAVLSSQLGRTSCGPSARQHRDAPNPHGHPAPRNGEPSGRNRAEPRPLLKEPGRRDREFESPFPQRRVRNEPSAARQTPLLDRHASRRRRDRR